MEDGILDAESAHEASAEARTNGMPFVSYLVQNELAEGRAIAISASEEFGIPILDLGSFDLDAIPSDIVKEKLVRQTQRLAVVTPWRTTVRCRFGSDEPASAR